MRFPFRYAHTETENGPRQPESSENAQASSEPEAKPAAASAVEEEDVEDDDEDDDEEKVYEEKEYELVKDPRAPSNKPGGSSKPQTSGTGTQKPPIKR